MEFCFQPYNTVCQLCDEESANLWLVIQRNWILFCGYQNPDDPEKDLQSYISCKF